MESVFALKERWWIQTPENAQSVTLNVAHVSLPVRMIVSLAKIKLPRLQMVNVFVLKVKLWTRNLDYVKSVTFNAPLVLIAQIIVLLAKTHLPRLQKENVYVQKEQLWTQLQDIAQNVKSHARLAFYLTSTIVLHVKILKLCCNLVNVFNFNINKKRTQTQMDHGD